MVMNTRSATQRRKSRTPKEVKTVPASQSRNPQTQGSKKQKNRKVKSQKEADVDKHCLLCLRKDPPLLVNETVNTKVKWIECDRCCKWIHTSCAGIEGEDLVKIGKKTWFKCIVCNLASLETLHTHSSVDIADLIQEAIDRRRKACEAPFPPKESGTITELEEDTGENSVDGVERDIVENPAVESTNIVEKDSPDLGVSRANRDTSEKKEIHSCKGDTLTKDLDPVRDISGSEIDQPDIAEENPGGTELADRLTQSKILITDRLKDLKVFSTLSRILGEYKKHFPK